MSNTKSTKSFKNPVREKPKHTGGIIKTKKGGSGKGSWGKPGEQVRISPISHDDPNYDPMESEKLFWKPPKERVTLFNQSSVRLTGFKKKVRAAIAEYMDSKDIEEFVRCIQELELPIFHQELPYILIRWSMDKKPEIIPTVSHTLAVLSSKKIISTNQLRQGFTKLFFNLDDMKLDNVEAQKILIGYLEHASANDLVEQKTSAELLLDLKIVQDERIKKKVNAKVDLLIPEYLDNGDMEEVIQAIKELHAPPFHFTVIKRLLYAAMDRKNREREMVSVLMAKLAGDVISVTQIEKAFHIMLCRVEDIALDVPNVFQLMSNFLARAVVDEALTPSFLLRVDLSEGDLGHQVLNYAQHLASGSHSSEYLAEVWTKEE